MTNNKTLSISLTQKEYDQLAKLGAIIKHPTHTLDVFPGILCGAIIDRKIYNKWNERKEELSSL